MKPLATCARPSWHDLGVEETDVPVPVSAYYARPNALARVLPPPARQVFADAWAWYGSQEFGGAGRSALAGLVANAIRTAYQVPDLAQPSTPQVGDWFVYDGVTIFRRPSAERSGQARIKRLDLGHDLRAVVRDDCMLTSTAYANMSGTVKGALLLGVFTSSETFELVVAGYQDRLASVLGSATATDWVTETLTLLRMEAGPGARFEISKVVDGAIRALEEVVVFRHGNELLDRDPAFRDERGFRAFFRVLEPWVLRPYGARLIPEADSGHGPVDFLITNGAETDALEFKQIRSTDHLSELIRGIAVQLPTYMDGHRVATGWYVVLVQGSLTDSDVHAIARALQDGNPRPDAIHIRLVDGRAQQSASVRRTIPRLLSESDP